MRPSRRGMVLGMQDDHWAREVDLVPRPWLERTITPRGLVVLLAVVLIACQLMAIDVAHETEGEIMAGLTLLITCSNVVLLPLAFWRPPLAVLLLVPWLLVVPRQVIAGHQLWRAQNEAARIVTWAYEVERETGAFPADLDDYLWRDPGIRDGIFSYGARDGEFGVSYGTPGTENSAHTFSSRSGWFYYPD